MLGFYAKLDLGYCLGERIRNEHRRISGKETTPKTKKSKTGRKNQILHTKIRANDITILRRIKAYDGKILKEQENK